MGGELDKVGTTALKETARRSALTQPTIIQIVRYLCETPMFRCAEAAHKKPALRWHLRALSLKAGFQSRHWILPVHRNGSYVIDRCQTV